MPKKTYDVFISHASEDKPAFVEPLALELRKRGLTVWFDKFVLRAGDSLRESIERGLSTSRYGIVVYSPNFFAKKWPAKEVNGLFSREIGGRKKRILPILHNLTISNLRKRYPIQSDRFSLSSAVPLAELCDELIREIKPELLSVRELQRRQFDASESFLEKASSEYPGYEFTVTSSSSPFEVDLSPFDLSHLPPFKISANKKIEMRRSNQSVSADLSLQMGFTGSGILKANDFIRTGKPQTWMKGEFHIVRSDVPLMTDHSDEADIFSLARMKDKNPRPVRLDVVGVANSIRFDFMQMVVSRHGTEEVEFRIDADHEALSFVMGLSIPNSGQMDFGFSWKIEGFSAKKCQRALEEIDAVLSGGTLTITDLRGELQALTLDLPNRIGLSAPVDDPFRKAVDLCVQIEERFGIVLAMKEQPDKSDLDSLAKLNSLLNAVPLDAVFNLKLELVKGQDANFDQRLCGGGSMEVEIDYSDDAEKGEFNLFGTKIKTDPWATRACGKIVMSNAEAKAYCKAKDGSKAKATLSSVGPLQLIWLDSLSKR